MLRGRFGRANAGSDTRDPGEWPFTRAPKTSKQVRGGHKREYMGDYDKAY